MNQPCTVSIPGSKSASHRALICAALAAGESRLHGLLYSADTLRTRAVLQSCGVLMQEDGDALLVRGPGGAPENTGGALRCDMGESGTSCRLLSAVLAAGSGQFEVFGAGRMHERPIAGLVKPLQMLGADISYPGKPGCPPLRIKSGGLCTEHLADGTVPVSAEESSQYLSALLMVAPLVRQSRQPLAIALSGKKAVSWPYVGITLQVMQAFGARFRLEEPGPDGNWQQVEEGRLERDFALLARPGNLRILVEERSYAPAEYQVEKDWSSASYFLAAGAAGATPVSVAGLRRDSAQGDRLIVDVLKKMGARASWQDDTITVYPATLTGIEINLEHAPDLAPTVLALAAHAAGKTAVRGIEHLAYKESDRLQALAQEFGKAGCIIESSRGVLELTPPPGGLHVPAEGFFKSHGDHRIVMALNVLGLSAMRGKGFTACFDNPECVEKSNPGFWTEWKKIIYCNS